MGALNRTFDPGRLASGSAILRSELQNCQLKGPTY